MTGSGTLDTGMLSSHARAGEDQTPTRHLLRVAVIDTGWDRSLADSRIETGIGLVGEQDELALHRSLDDHDRIGHGTACIGVLLGVAPSVRILPVRVFGRRLETSPSVLLAALEWVVDERLPLVNLSLGTPRADVRAPLYRICRRAADQGTIIVAAGSRPGGRWSLPSSFDCVIGVLPESQQDPHHVEYVPGSAFECRASPHQITRGRGGRRVRVTGVSFATPVVTGWIARILEHSPSIGLDGLRARLAEQ